MAKIKNITVSVKYTVGLGGIIVPKNVMQQLNKIANSLDEIDFSDTIYDAARDWIIENIKERDCCESSFEITDLEI